MRKTIVLIAILLLFKTTFSQQYNFIKYSVEEGLAQSQVRSICQDNHGYLWIGTLGGLSKFDGVNFEIFSTKEGLLDNQINSIYKDSKGNMWFGTNGGVTYYNGNQFVKYPFKSDFHEHTVLSITEDDSGNLWFATDGGGLAYLDKDLEFNYLKIVEEGDENYIRSIVFDNKKLWLATRNGVFSIDKSHNIKLKIENVNASQIAIENDKVWCSTYGQGILVLHHDSCTKITMDDGLISNHIRGFVKRSNGSYWFVAKNGVSKYKDGTFKNFSVKDGLKNENIKCVIEDDEGNLFFGADGGGLIKFTNEDFVSYTQEDFIKSNVIMSITEDQNKNIWLSTYGDGIGVFTSKGYFLYTTKDGLGNNTVWCSMVSSKPSLWVGTSNGISEFDGKKFTTYDTENGLNAKKVYALQEDAEGNLWIGTKEGVSVFDNKTHNITNLDIARNIRFIFLEQDDKYWFCSSDGLILYNKFTDTHKIFTDLDGLPSASVMNILKDEQQRYWIGTTNGLAFFYQDQFHKVEIPGNYAANNINFLQLDKYNNLWIGTNFGLYQLNIEDKLEFNPTDFIRYSNLDGLKSLECNQNAGFIDSQNNLWFGTSYGLVKHKLSDKRHEFTLPKVQLKDILLFYERFDFKKYSSGIIPNTQLPKELVLPHHKNHLTFDFTGIYHTNPNKVRFKFRLDGFDDDWQPITTSNSVTYSNIPSGNFTFMLSATTDLKNWTIPISFSFIVQSPFWLRWWFVALCVFFVLGIIFLIIVRRRKIKEGKRETQLIVDKSKMLSLEQQALNSSMNRHFIFNALNSIQYYINRQDKIAANKYLSNFAKLVRKNLDSSLVNEVYLDDEIERTNLYLKLEQMRFQNKFDYEIKVNHKLEPQTIKIPSMLLQPFIENSIWHGILPSSKKGMIAINIDQENDKLIIKVKDNGIGIDVSLHKKENKQQHHESKGMKLTKGRINLFSKISHKDFAIKGPYQIYDENKNVSGTEVVIVLSIFKNQLQNKNKSAM